MGCLPASGARFDRTNVVLFVTRRLLVSDECYQSKTFRGLRSSFRPFFLVSFTISHRNTVFLKELKVDGQITHYRKLHSLKASERCTRRPLMSLLSSRPSEHNSSHELQRVRSINVVVVVCRMPISIDNADTSSNRMDFSVSPIFFVNSLHTAH